VRNSQIGGAHGITEKGGRRRPPRSPPPISTPDYIYGILSVHEVTILLMVTKCSGKRSLSKLRM